MPPFSFGDWLYALLTMGIVLPFTDACSHYLSFFFSICLHCQSSCTLFSSVISGSLLAPFSVFFIEYLGVFVYTGLIWVFLYLLCLHSTYSLSPIDLFSYFSFLSIWNTIISTVLLSLSANSNIYVSLGSVSTDWFTSPLWARFFCSFSCLIKFFK